MGSFNSAGARFVYGEAVSAHMHLGKVGVA